jgi:beta-mannosidase
MTLKKTLLDKGWEFRQETTLNNSTASEFLPVAQFPTVAHIDLLHHGLIKDPYIDQNELQSLWVNDADWTYRTTFQSPELDNASSAGNAPHLPLFIDSKLTQNTALVFDGLDTIVSVYLNSQLILTSQNMHISHKVDITSLLSSSPNSINHLELRFKNAPEFAKKEMKRIGYKGNGTDVHFGGPERLFVRKAQYNWGWDWGPSCNTCGPWKEVWIETYEKRIGEFVVRQKVDEGLQSAKVTIQGMTEGLKEGEKVILTIEDPDGKEVSKVEAAVDKEGAFDEAITLDRDLQLWYPFTFGASPLYTVTGSIASQHSLSQKLGLRKLKLLQHPLKNEPGTSFVFEINNIRVFAGGSCWIPGDYLLPRFTKERYEEWLMLAKSGNQVMIRVWGGGIVESNDFYEICDREGILVWQDFLFACGDYPASDDFIEGLKVEFEQQVKRVGYHARYVFHVFDNFEEATNYL